jgi:hypothetical protein
MHTDTIVDGTAETLLLYMMEWLEANERSYEEVMETWHTTCPRLPVWEEANNRGLVSRELVQGREVVRLTSSGKAVLRKRRFMSIMRDYLKAVVS